MLNGDARVHFTAEGEATTSGEVEMLEDANDHRFWKYAPFIVVFAN
jgi:hypothetical protein